MGLTPDTWIRDTALKHRMIEPFADHSPPGPIISYGLSSYGYDLRLADEFKIFTNVNSAIIDPKAFTETAFVTRKGSVCLMPPNSYVLGRSLEYFRLPRNERTRIAAADFSRIRHADLGRFTVDRLISILNRTATFDTPNLSRYTTTA